MQHFIINLTQHSSTPEQGVYDLPEGMQDQLKDLLTFEELPTLREIKSRAAQIADLASLFFSEEMDDLELDLVDGEFTVSAMIGGAPYLMGPLEAALKENNIDPLYAFSMRISSEYTDADGNVRKEMIFKHLGFVEV